MHALRNTRSPHTVRAVPRCRIILYRAIRSAHLPDVGKTSATGQEARWVRCVVCDGTGLCAATVRVEPVSSDGRLGDWAVIPASQGRPIEAAPTARLFGACSWSGRMPWILVGKVVGGA